jgi:uncharacterized protein
MPPAGGKERRERTVDALVTSELDEFRARKDTFFGEDPESPLPAVRRAVFEGLRYFPESEALRLRARLETEGVDLDERIVMQTTTGGEQVYRRAGVVRFEVEREPAQLTLFASDDSPDLFVPFRDATSGTDTYGAGRYLEVEPPGRDGMVDVDLNYAYNPFCAYSPEWSCPIPPGENWLAVPIRVGERSFPGAHEVSIGS